MNYKIDFNRWVIQRHVLIATINNMGSHQNIIDFKHLPNLKRQKKVGALELLTISHTLHHRL